MARLLAAAALLAALGTGAAAQESETWPCVQAKVPTLTPAAIWAGPPLDGATDWTADPEVADLVARLSQRRVPVEEAEAEIEAFADGLSGPDARERLLLLFAGLFETMNAERSEVIEGIERYASKQIAMAESIREEASALDARRATEDPTVILAAEDELYWRTRVFDERRASLTYVCDVPRLIEQRLFALGRVVAAGIEEG